MRVCRHSACTTEDKVLYVKIEFINDNLILKKYRKTESPEDDVTYSQIMFLAPFLLLHQVTSNCKNGARMRFLPAGRAVSEDHRIKEGPRLDRARRTDSPRVPNL